MRHFCILKRLQPLLGLGDSYDPSLGKQGTEVRHEGVGQGSVPRPQDLEAVRLEGWKVTDSLEVSTNE